MHYTKDTSLAIVDLETTGTHPVNNRIIEIGIVRVEQGMVVKEYQSLVDPDTYVPPFVTSLTGISSLMVEGAPSFETVAYDVFDFLKDALIVAHNANFDYSFLEEEFRRVGIHFSAPFVCSARLAKALSPRHKRHNLDMIIKRFDIVCENRHRALGDAKVVAEFMQKAAIKHGMQFEETVNSLIKTRKLPPSVPEHLVKNLPDVPGVYRFYSKDDELLYVGKSNRIRTRVRSHFTGDWSTGRGQDMLEHITRIETDETVGEVGALLLESHLIKTLAPVYNVMSRRKNALFLATHMRSDDGYATLNLGYASSIDPELYKDVMAVFKNRRQAKEELTRMAKEHTLCPHLLGIENSNPCFNFQLELCAGACAGKEKSRVYNRRFREAFAERQLKVWPFEGPIVLEERRAGKGEIFIINHWLLIAGLRYSHDSYEEFIPKSLEFDYDTYKILARHIFKKHPRLIIRELYSEERVAFSLEDGSTVSI